MKKPTNTQTPEQIGANLEEVIVVESEAEKAHEAKVAELKAKHKLDTICTLIVGDATGYLRKPNRKDVSMSRALGEGDEIKIAELLLDAVWLEGDERIRTDDDYFLIAIQKLNYLIDQKNLELKKN